MSKQVFELDVRNSQSNTDVAERFAREIYVFGGGIASGVAKEIYDHPQQSAEKLGTAVATGAVLGAAATAELPALAIGAAGVGAVLTGKYIWDLIDPTNPTNQRRNASLQSAAATAWQSCDQSQLNRALYNLSDACGPTAVDILAGIAGGSAAHLGAVTPSCFASRFGPLDPANVASRFAVPTLTPSYAPALNGSGEILSSQMTHGDSAESPKSLTDFVNFIQQHGRVQTRPYSDNQPNEVVAKSPAPDAISLVETEDAITAFHHGNWYRLDKHTGNYSIGNVTAPLGEPNGPNDFDSHENGTRSRFFKDKH